MIELIIIIIGLLFVIWMLLLVIGYLWHRIVSQPKTLDETLDEMRYRVLKRKLP